MQLRPTSASKALSITELLEDILLYLPIHQLSASKRVCRHFKSAIEGSLAIQKRLFLETGDISDSRLDGELYPSFQFADGTMPLMNPMLHEYACDLKRLAQARPGHWQNTLVTQPAVTELNVAIYRGFRRVKKLWNGLPQDVKNPEGIKIKDLADLAINFYSNAYNGNYDIRLPDSVITWLG
ncbi:hypothetical protein PRZ48_001619 [Zasmidium cellare]|uniref:F-box domain-containing protein n=1 Tax=Zasmidium cellare TaxID=395010 RepID=A0ABR0F2R4_ZASCE|nr:hypothetical protein PRZ48_001619 [Zasmidium cellare]